MRQIKLWLALGILAITGLAGYGHHFAQAALSHPVEIAQPIGCDECGLG